eukprot:4059598-Amphidinium_carterae.1
MDSSSQTNRKARCECIKRLRQNRPPLQQTPPLPSGQDATTAAEPRARRSSQQGLPRLEEQKKPWKPAEEAGELGKKNAPTSCLWRQACIRQETGGALAVEDTVRRKSLCGFRLCGHYVCRNCCFFPDCVDQPVVLCGRHHGYFHRRCTPFAHPEAIEE